MTVEEHLVLQDLNILAALFLVVILWTLICGVTLCEFGDALVNNHDVANTECRRLEAEGASEASEAP